ncbi:hypothetical protein N431DRAFT_354150 [Stipitochalara longipes BDJ]|nr:hypothetical protein N431DRAFT_354150 [Stipitochalara longipes BDJ]
MESSPNFSLFTSLPSELRIKIWRSSFPGPRVVPVRFQRPSSQYISDSSPPSLLHVCSESRSLFLSIYTKLILSPKYDSAVFVNFAIDTIFFDNLDCSPDGDLSLDLARSPHRTRILSCAIDSQVWEILRVFKYDPLSEVRMMPSLRTMALVMLRDRDGAGHSRIQADRYGSQNVNFRMDSNTVEAEIMHVQGWVDILRTDLQQPLELLWTGDMPNVQMWIW